MWNKIQRIYIGSNLVRPNEITETYTIPVATSTGSTVRQYQVIWKTWWKIKKAIVQTSWQCSSTSRYWNFNIVFTDTHESGTFYRSAIWWGRNNYWRIEFWWTNRNISWYSTSWLNEEVFTVSREDWSTVINQQTTSWTLSWSELQRVVDIFDSTLAEVYIQATYGYNWPATVTVTYSIA